MKDFLNHIDSVIVGIQQSAFEYYHRIYAKYYEKPFEDSPLSMNSKEEHFAYMRDIVYLRILDHKTIKIPIHYSLDSEHGLELKITDNHVINIAGIAET